jgi:opacity protein-like surface antigen
MRKFSLVILLVMGMACAARSAKAAPQGGSQVTITNNGQPASGVSFVLDISNQGKTAKSTGTTDNQGSPSNVLDLSNVGKVKVDVYVEVCQNGQHVVIVDSGMTPPDDGSCKMRRRIGGFWLTGSDTLKIDVGTGTAIVTHNGGGSSIGSSSTTDQFEVFGGYSFLHISSDGYGYNYNGGSGSLDWNPTPWLGIVGDFGGYHYSKGDETSNIFTYLFGPKVSLHKDSFTPFAQALFGGAHFTDKECSGTGSMTTCDSGSENAFAMALGGGVDWNATPHLGVRLFQLEYLMSRFSSQTQNNVRLSVGGVIRW